MASMQCYQTVEKTCNQVSCPPMTNQGQVTHSSKGHGHGSSRTHCTNQNCVPNNGTTCHGRTKKKGLLQRIKDSLDGHSSDSSSDSESDGECCGKTKTVKKQ